LRQKTTFKKGCAKKQPFKKKLRQKTTFKKVEPKNNL
jgi:hypothetical protein